ncbi:adenylate/guanylate cyclase domain-containing protein [Phyllobacterium myrsinacearum]|uniref:Adenylate cyclase n=1 Tax=Phyllobacterium myrsinacearum TaxID=28101 RepID=A0A839EPK0_9HYPH|nr:adenylate/guanylate cyclase domain-containing protein [Phyllobacterium myrsinacearum]MBA8882001.1 adenylate cyclase [Phyllobacterium myrsinacearum]
MRRISLGFWMIVLAVVAVGGFLSSPLVYEGSSFMGAFVAVCVCIPVLAFERRSALPKLHAWVRTRNSFGFWIVILTVVAASGVFYSVVVYGGSPFVGAIFGLCICTPLLAFERGLIFPRLHLWMNSLPTFSFILVGLTIYYILINIGFALCGATLWSLGMVTTSFFDSVVLPPNVLLYTLGVTALMTFFLRVRELLGRDIFTSLVIGRYRQPVAEERVFLFIDLVGSTSFAEKHGDLRAQQFLGALFAEFAEPVRRHRGAIDDYVGDSAIITWPIERGIKDASCVRCVFDILDVIEANATQWLERFGQVPRLRAALHGGPVITAEIGVDHHKITYFGDTVNTTARLESLCRTLEAPVLISSDLVQRIKLSNDIKVKDLGFHGVKGRGQALGVIALTR